ncbi:Apoptosis-inducing factor 2 [Fusarium austroafricanum]|uniref:Apoptosis-inducing factor 2 n=1 Tax=Fusarium austroafricanum TaxID=2364996 RepID=A0A8H4P327_9HYPO|nr:Apoptosis-inducing factor 2 [Fusarium austroafricanum]
MTKTVVVLGGSLGGMAVTHQLLKYTRPRQEDLKVILVSKSSHFYWNLASVRAIVPGVIKDDEILAPIKPGLDQYPAGSVEFIIGTASAVDPTARIVTVDTDDGTDHGTLLKYDHLVIATGAETADPSLPWKASSSHEELLGSLHNTAERVEKATHIVVAGAGATGVELAGEIQYAYPSTTVILISAEEKLVAGDQIAGSVESELKRLGVEIRAGVRSEGTTELPDGKTLVKLSNGETIATDLFLATMGLRPNSGFLPKEWLTKNDYIDVDDEMRVKNTEGVWAVGDVVSKPRAAFLITEAQAAGVFKNIDLVLKGKEPQPVSPPRVDAFLCATGRSRGAGRLGKVPVPSLAVWAVKGRTLGLERTKKYVSGSMW